MPKPKSTPTLIFFPVCLFFAFIIGACSIQSLTNPRQESTLIPLETTSFPTTMEELATPTEASPTQTAVSCGECGKWIALPVEGAPSGRANAMIFWTGSELLIWGGKDAGPFTVVPSGGIYDPINGKWRSISTTGKPTLSGTVTVWTGTDMIIWGGYRMGSTLAIGGRYNPSTDTWTDITQTNAPQGRWSSRAVWTGTEMMFFGGFQGGLLLGDGGRYDPQADKWSSINNQGAPSARCSSSVEWTGTEMLVWGGFGEDSLSPVADGARYDPVTDQWKPISTVDAPVPLDNSVSIWTGQEMIVFGSFTKAGQQATAGGRYNPVLDKWFPLSSQIGSLDQAADLKAVWTGDQMIVGGTVIHDGKYQFEMLGYDPATDHWISMDTKNAPANSQMSIVWTGADLYLWGGQSGDYSNTGVIYKPLPLLP